MNPTFEFVLIYGVVFCVVSEGRASFVLVAVEAVMKRDLVWLGLVIAAIALAGGLATVAVRGDGSWASLPRPSREAARDLSRFVLNVEMHPTCGTGDPPIVVLHLAGTPDGGARWGSWSTLTRTSPSRHRDGELDADSFLHYVECLERRGLWGLGSTAPASIGFTQFQLHVEDGARRLDAEIGGSLLERPEQDETYKRFGACFNRTLYGEPPRDDLPEPLP